MPDIVLYYADFGRPYLPLIERMTRSARKVMPNARVVLLTPTPSKALGKLFDVTCPIDVETTLDNLCRERARAMVSWMLATGENTIFVDPDIEFREAPQFGRFDVGLMWRKKKPDQPVNTGLILARPGFEQFWRRYGHIAVNLPPDIHHWWCDQLAFALLTGVCHQPGETLLIEEARVKLLDMATLCPRSDQATPESWALHFKGGLKGEDFVEGVNGAD
jgi:hypothetical protein